MNMESEIEYGSPFGKLEQVSFRCEYEYFIFVKVHFKLVHHFQRVVICIFKSFAY